MYSHGMFGAQVFIAFGQPYNICSNCNYKLSPLVTSPEMATCWGPNCLRNMKLIRGIFKGFGFGTSGNSEETSVLHVQVDHISIDRSFLAVYNLYYLVHWWCLWYVMTHSGNPISQDQPVLFGMGCTGLVVFIRVPTQVVVEIFSYGVLQCLNFRALGFFEATCSAPWLEGSTS